MVTFEEIEVGQKFYLYLPSSVSIIEYTKISDERFSTDDTTYEKARAKGLEFYESLDEVSIVHYKTALELAQDAIEEHQQRIDRHKSKIKKLDDEYSHLKEKYPEQFI